MIRCIIFLIACTVLVSSTKTQDQNALVDKVQCVTDNMDVIASEFDIDDLWQDVQQKLLKNINTLFGCLKNTGFTLQRYEFDFAIMKKSFFNQ